MEYLKVWTSFRQVISPLSDDEKGRLFVAMLAYAETGEEPDNFTGNERFLWIAAKQDIDRTAKKCETLRINASKGGYAKSKNRQQVANDSISYQTVANVSNDQQTEANAARNIKKSNIKKSKVKENNNNDIFARFWNAYPRKTAKENAQKAFCKLNPDEGLLQIMLAAIEKQKQTAQWQEDNGRYIPHPATWLNQKRWEDEVTKTTTATVVAQQYDQRDYSDIKEQMQQEQDREMEEWLKQQEG